MIKRSSETVLMTQLYNASLPRGDEVEKIVVKIKRKKGDHFSAKLKTLHGYKISATGLSIHNALSNLGKEMVLFYPLSSGEQMSIGKDGSFILKL